MDPGSHATADAKAAEKNASSTSHHSDEYSPYPTIDPKDVGVSVGGSENWGTFVMGSPSDPSSDAAVPSSREGNSSGVPLSSPNPYVSASPAGNGKNKMESVREVLGQWGKKVMEAKEKTQDIAGNVWQHLKTGPSVADTAMGRIAQGTKVLAEGGYEKIFQHTFDTLPGEQLQSTYACYLSTSAGPVIGILYLSSAKLAFCSDNPLSYKVGNQTEWSYYKVIIPLHQLKAVNASASKMNPAEKYVQVISVDNHEFWFMGFMTYDSAVKSLENALADHRSQKA